MADRIRQDPVVMRIAQEVQLRQVGESSGHDWTHTVRVWNLSLVIAEAEGADPIITSLAALLHDVGDWKLFGGDENAGYREVRSILAHQQCDLEISDHVITIISELSFLGGGTPRPMSTVEGRVVQDADRLDAIGAIGIARCFAFGGAKGRVLYDPEYEPRLNMTAEEYKQSKVDSISHFHEKLLLLKDLMNTDGGRRIAEERHGVMLRFLDDFSKEWDQGYSMIDEQLRWT